MAPTPSSSNDRMTHRRRRPLLLVCGALLLGAIAATVLGLPGESFLLHALLWMATGVAVLFALAWGAGKTLQALLLLAGCAVGLLLAELGLRLLVPADDYDESVRSLYEYDPQLGWRFQPGAEARLRHPAGDFASLVRINAQGFRDAEFEGRETVSNERQRPLLAVLGDSFVSNLGVERDDVFTRRLAEHWDGAVEVRNYGVNGYGQVQQLLLLESLLAARRPPDAVLVVLFPYNDPADNLGQLDWLTGYGRPVARFDEAGRLEIVRDFAPPVPKSAPAAPHRWLSGLRTVEVARNFLLRTLFTAGIPGFRAPPDLRSFARDSAGIDSAGLDVTVALLKEMSARCRAGGVRFGVVLAPAQFQLDDHPWHALLERADLAADEYDRRGPNRRLEAACRDADLPCLDLLPPLEAAAADGQPIYFAHDGHWNARGNARVAELLAAWLVELEWFNAP